MSGATTKVALLGLAIVATAAQATYVNGYRLLEMCDTGAQTSERCSAYLEGVVDAHEKFTKLGRMEKLWCLPDGVTPAELRGLIVGRIRAVPQGLHGAATTLLSYALNDAFPCGVTPTGFPG